VVLNGGEFVERMPWRGLAIRREYAGFAKDLVPAIINGLNQMAKSLEELHKRLPIAFQNITKEIERVALQTKNLRDQIDS